jgi:hypothetical protein
VEIKNMSLSLRYLNVGGPEDPNASILAMYLSKVFY